MQWDVNRGWGKGLLCHPMGEGKRETHKWATLPQCFGRILVRIGITGPASTNGSSTAGATLATARTRFTEGTSCRTSNSSDNGLTNGYCSNNNSNLSPIYVLQPERQFNKFHKCPNLQIAF